MPFIIQTIEPRVQLACNMAHDFLKVVVSGEVDLPDSFTHTSMSPDQVRLHIASCMESMKAPVGTYKTRPKIVGRFYRGRIEYNVTNLLRHDNSFISGNIAHELMHFYGFRHKGNFKTRNRNSESVPYVIGDLCRTWVIAHE